MQQVREHQRLVFMSREPTQRMMPDRLGMAAVAQDDFARRRAGTVDQPLQFERGDDVGIEAVAVLGDPLRVEEFEARGDDDVADLDLDQFLLLRESQWPGGRRRLPGRSSCTCPS